MATEEIPVSADATKDFPMPGKDFSYKSVDASGKPLAPIPYKALDLNVLGRASTPRMNSQLWAFRSLWLIIGAHSDAQHRETGVGETAVDKAFH
jgi:hypothetical protein